MKKVISSLLIATMFSTVASAQTVNTNTLKKTTQNIIDDFDDDDTPTAAAATLKKVNDSTSKMFLKPNNQKEADKLAKKDEIPDNIKQDYKEDDGYLLEGFQLGVGIGILGGVNAQVGYRIPRREYNFWKNRFGFRIDYNSWKPLESKIKDYLEENPIDVADNDFTGMINGTNYGALIDFYPFGNTWFLGNFRISGGYYTGDFDMDIYMHKSASKTFEMQGIKYSGNADAMLRAALAVDVKGPYLGTGFDFQILYGLKFYFDAGVVFIDNPRIETELTGTGELTACFTDSPASCRTETISQDSDVVKQLLEDTKEEYEDLTEAITNVKIFPMVKVGLMLRF
ncbi:MAG: hypothetical protein K6F04_00395 [bacterium]|nr:hypothetical protein [bacterium]